jgi:hypothetical protein
MILINRIKGGNMDSLKFWCGHAVLAIFLLTNARAVSALECTVCHSKNPAMVKMHQATKDKDISCFDCHKIGEKLMGRGQPKDRDSLLKRRASEGVCKGCHQ